MFIPQELQDKHCRSDFVNSYETKVFFTNICSKLSDITYCICSYYKNFKTNIAEVILLKVKLRRSFPLQTFVVRFFIKHKKSTLKPFTCVKMVNI